MWLRDKKHGQGKMEFANGDVYEGEWYRGLMHGHGELTTVDGGRCVAGSLPGLSRGGECLSSKITRTLPPAMRVNLKMGESMALAPSTIFLERSGMGSLRMESRYG